MFTPTYPHYPQIHNFSPEIGMNFEFMPTLKKPFWLLKWLKLGLKTLPGDISYEIILYRKSRAGYVRHFELKKKLQQQCTLNLIANHEMDIPVYCNFSGNHRNIRVKISRGFYSINSIDYSDTWVYNGVLFPFFNPENDSDWNCLCHLVRRWNHAHSHNRLHFFQATPGYARYNRNCSHNVWRFRN